MRHSRNRGMTSRPRPPVERLEPRAYLTIAFAAPQTQDFSILNGPAQAPVLADFNNDGNLDALVAASSAGGQPGFLYLAIGQGNGTLAALAQVGTAVFDTAAVTGDFNDDGNLDVAVSDFAANQVHLFLGNGDGTLDSPLDLSTSAGPYGMTVGDFNRDGIDDLAIGNRSANTVEIRFGGPALLIAPPTSLAVGDDPASLLAGDFDNDGDLDLLVGNQSSGNLSRLVNNGQGGFTALAPADGPGNVVGVADLNGDGNLDLIRGINQDAKAVISLGDGAFGFAAAANSSNSGVFAYPADFDGDRKVDLAFVGTTTAATTFVLPGKGDGTFADALEIQLPAEGVGRPGDLNHDGLDDLVFVGVSDSGNTLNTLLAAPTGPNLTPEVITPLPQAGLGGVKGKIAVRITNNGSEPFKGKAETTLSASTDTVANAGDLPLGSVTKNFKLKPGQFKVVTFKIALPKVDGTYLLLAQFDPQALTNDTNRVDNTAVSGTALTIVAPYVDLSPSFPTALAPSYRIGKAGNFTVLIANNGNVAAKSRVPYTLFASTDEVVDPGDIVLRTGAKRVKIKPDGTRAMKLKVKIPSTLPPGSYRLFAHLDTTLLGDSDPSNDTALASELFTVVP